MKIRKSILTAILLLSVVIVNAQRVSDASFYQSGKLVEISYMLDETADIAVYVSLDGGKSFRGPLTAVSGDVGKLVSAGRKQIVWTPLEEYEKIVSDDVVFKIVPSVKQKLTRKDFTETVNGVDFKMVWVEGGTFTMGCTYEQGGDCDRDENPSHQVTLSGYYIGQTEVTQALWQAVMGSNPSNFKGSNYPVEQVSWDDCQEFIRKLNALTGKRFALPTEAQWEYAARGGKKSQGYKYAGSNSLGNVAWYWDNGGSSTHPVATKSPNELGLYDMSGNVWEWCSDWNGAYSSSAQTNPTGPSSGSPRVFRGGSWHFNAQRCRVANRSCSTPSIRDRDLGFRVVLLP